MTLKYLNLYAYQQPSKHLSEQVKLMRLADKNERPQRASTANARLQGKNDYRQERKRQCFVEGTHRGVVLTA